MKPRILNTDTSYIENPDGTYRGAKNLVSVPVKNIKINEAGFQIFEETGITNTPAGNRNNHKFSQIKTIGGVDYQLIPVGEVVCDKNRFITFSIAYDPANTISDVVFSEIGLTDEKGYYTTVINDKGFTTENKLNFSPYYPITGEYNYYNSKLIVGFTDYNQKPKLINIDYYLINPPSVIPFVINDILMFPDATQINTTVTVNNEGGLLESGSHYMVYAYKDREGVMTNCGYIDDPIAIFLDNITGSGADVLSEGSLPNIITNKSVSLALTNVDVRFKFLVIFVIKKIQGGKTITQQITEIPITGSTMNYIYTGQENTADIDITSILVRNTYFSKVHSFAQIQNNLYAARTVGRPIIKYQKYANMIQLTCCSKIIIPANGQDAKTSTYSHDNKSHAHREVTAAYIHWKLKDGSISEGFHIPSFNTQTESELKALGYNDSFNSRYIRTGTVAITTGLTTGLDTVVGTGTAFLTNIDVGDYIYINGEGHSVLTITDDTHLTIGSTWAATTAGADYSISFVLSHIEGLGDNIQRFQIEDTCSTITKNPSGTSEIACGLWQNQNETYPDNPDGDFDSTVDYNGVALGGLNLKGKKVRHHRMPSIEYMKTNIYDANVYYGQNQLDLIGINLSGVVVPAELVGLVDSWCISFAVRDYNNCTVLGQSHPIFGSYQSPATPYTISSNGFNVKMGYDWNGAGFNKEGLLAKSAIRTYDFALMNNRAAISPTFIANELFFKDVTVVYLGGLADVLHTISGNRKTVLVDLVDTATRTITNAFNPDGVGSNCRVRKVISHKYLVSNADDGSGVNNSKLEEAFYMTLNRDLTVNTENFEPCFDDTGVGSAWGTIVNYQSYLTSIMALPQDVYNSFYTQKLLFSGIYTTAGTTSLNNLYKGDVFIVINSINAMGTGGVGGGGIASLGDWSGVRVAHLWICECIYNSELRISSANDPRTQYSFRYVLTGSPANRLDALSNSNCALPYDFNKDYIAINDLNELSPFNPYTLKNNQTPYRISKSKTELAETNVNNWKIWLVNDYKESVKNKGDLNNIAALGANLIIHHEKALFITRGNEQLNVSGVHAIIGSGNIFDRDFKEIVPSKEGSYGTQNKLSCVVTPAGYVFIDADYFTFNLYQGGETVKELSEDLMKEFFINNSTIDSSFKGLVNLPVLDNPYFFNGFTVGFDIVYNRIILTKKHYEVSPQGETNLEEHHGRWTDKSGTPILIDYNNDFFINKSFTLSYSLNDKGFTCFHDYTPNKMFFTRDNLLSFINTIESNRIVSRIYKHNFFGDETYTRNKGIYYNTSIKDIDSGVAETGTPFSSYIVACFSPAKEYREKPSFQFFNVNWIANIFNANEAFIIDKTFNKLLAFNSKQSTDEMDLVIFDFNNYFTANTRNIQGKWNFNALRNLLRNDIFTTPNPQEPFILIDSLNTVINPIDATKPFYDKKPLVDKFLLLKLLYNNEISSNLQNEIQIIDIDSNYNLVPR